MCRPPIRVGAGTLPPLEPCSRRKAMKVAIVGGGITGASAASSLAGYGIEVTVFDQGGRGPGGRASHRRVDAASGTVGPDDALLAPEDAVFCAKFFELLHAHVPHPPFTPMAQPQRIWSHTFEN